MGCNKLTSTSLHSMSHTAQCFSDAHPNKPISLSILKSFRNAFESSEITQHAFKGIERSKGEEKGLSMPVLSKHCQNNTQERPLSLSLLLLLTQDPYNDRKYALGVPVRLRHVILALNETQGLLMVWLFFPAQSHF